VNLFQSTRSLNVCRRGSHTILSCLTINQGFWQHVQHCKKSGCLFYAFKHLENTLHFMLQSGSSKKFIHIQQIFCLNAPLSSGPKCIQGSQFFSWSTIKMIMRKMVLAIAFVAAWIPLSYSRATTECKMNPSGDYMKH